MTGRHHLTHWRHCPLIPKGSWGTQHTEINARTCVYVLGAPEGHSRDPGHPPLPLFPAPSFVNWHFYSFLEINKGPKTFRLKQPLLRDCGDQRGAGEHREGRENDPSWKPPGGVRQGCVQPKAGLWGRKEFQAWLFPAVTGQGCCHTSGLERRDARARLLQLFELDPRPLFFVVCLIWF